MLLLGTLLQGFGTVACMSWSDEPENEERSEEWDSMVGDVYSTIESLTERFGENQTAGVISSARFLIEQVKRLHEESGVLHLPSFPVIDIASDADLVGRLAEEYFDEEDDDHEVEERKTQVTFTAVGHAAIASARPLEDALGRVDRDFDAVGESSAGALVELADAAAVFAEWSHIYVEAALGYYEVMGCMPDGASCSGTLEDMYQWEQVEQLRADIQASLVARVAG